MPRNRASQHATPNGNDRETPPVDIDYEKERLWTEKLQAGAKKRLAEDEAAREIEKRRDPKLVPSAAYLAARMQIVSIAMLQRRLRIPYAQASRVLDLLEEKGVVGPKEDSYFREVLMTIDDLAASGIVTKEAIKLLSDIEKRLAEYNATRKRKDPELVPPAAYLVARMQIVSIAMLQRQLRIPYAQASRVLDLLEEKGVVGPKEDSYFREVLMTIDDLAASGIVTKEALQTKDVLFNQPSHIYTL